MLCPDTWLRLRESHRRQVIVFFAICVSAVIAVRAPAIGAQLKTAKIAVALSLTGPNQSLGKPQLEGARLAVEEANESGAAPTIEISVHDDESDAERGRKIAREIGDSDALVVLGPATTSMALNVGQIYSDAGVVAIGPSTTGDKVTDPSYFFRAIFSTNDNGEMLAGYIRYNLGGSHAIVLSKQDSYGQAVTDGFKRAAEYLGIAADYRFFKNADEAEVVAGLDLRGAGRQFR